MTQYVNNFQEWAEKWYRKAKKDINIDSIAYPSHNIVFVVDKETGNTAYARFKSNEIFNSIIGTGIAYAKFCGAEIPKER